MFSTIAWAYCGIVVMLSVFTSGHKFKVVRRVVQTIPILVMNNLFSLKRASKHLLHHQPVFKLPVGAACNFNTPIISVTASRTKRLRVADADQPLVFFCEFSPPGEGVAQHPFASSLSLGNSSLSYSLAMLLCKRGTLAPTKGIANLWTFLSKVSLGEFTLRFFRAGLSFWPRHSSMVAQSIAG